MDRAALRAWWFERQGLGMGRHASAEETLARTGWARSVGGANPYLALHARGGFARQAIDAEVERVEIHELPSARGCTYIVPRRDFAIALLVGASDKDPSEVALAKKEFGLTEAELERLEARVLKALSSGPLDPRQLKEEAGEAVRSFGPEGKKRGMTSTLPMALGRLQARGAIRRIPVDGRLDGQRYRYALWSPGPLEGVRMSREEAFSELARRYFRWIGPASLAQFQWFSGLGSKAAKEAVAPLGLVPLDDASDLLLFPEDRDSLLTYRAPEEPQIALVGSLDNLMHLRREVRELVDEADHDREVRGERGPLKLGALSDLPSHGIFDRGRLIGLWEFDPDAGRIAWRTFAAASREVEEAVRRTESFVREELGDARSFSLDSPESRRPRIEALAPAAV